MTLFLLMSSLSKVDWTAPGRFIINLQKIANLQKVQIFHAKSSLKEKVCDNKNHANYDEVCNFKNHQPSKFKFAKIVLKFQYLEVGLNVDLTWQSKNKAKNAGLYFFHI